MVLIGDMLRRDARLLTRKVGVVEGDKSLTYGELNSRVNRLANALSKLGIRKGDKIAFMGNNSHQFVEFYFAVAKGGFVSIPVNARFSAEEATYLIKNSEASTLIYADDVAGVVKKIRESVPEITRCVSTGKSEAGAMSYEGLLENASDQEPHANVSPDDMTMIMYTSGATGAPKGVVATQRNIMANTNTQCLETRHSARRCHRARHAHLSQRRPLADHEHRLPRGHRRPHAAVRPGHSAASNPGP